jgi:hypothetical protein
MKINALLFDLNILRVESLDAISLDAVEVIYDRAVAWFKRKKK